MTLGTKFVTSSGAELDPATLAGLSTYEAATGRGSGAIERARTARACPSKFSVLRVLRRDADRSRQYLAERPSIKLLTSNGAEESGKGSADGCSTSAYGVPSAHLLTAQV